MKTGKIKIAKILMVDDDLHIRKIAEISLRKVGKWEVYLASSGEEALALAQQELPDVILLDVTMANLDGPATFARLKECPQTAGIPVIFLTGRVLSDELEEYHRLGVDGIIHKPFDPMKLPEQIDRMLNEGGEERAKS
jgi:CheY-like chemotaxis protein